MRFGKAENFLARISAQSQPCTNPFSLLARSKEIRPCAIIVNFGKEAGTIIVMVEIVNFKHY
jgi:hypothetical protein